MHYSLFALAGTRPEQIKLEPLLRALRQYPAVSVESLWSGQHAPAPSGVRPLRPPRGHPLRRTELERQIRRAVSEALVASPVDALIVQGDTATAISGARAAQGLRIPLVHLEAGLRSGSLRSPFPEEAYRRELSRLADLNLTPCRQATLNLLHDGVAPEQIRQVGSTAVDQLPPPAPRSIRRDLDLLVDIHRRENRGAALARLVAVLGQLAADGLGVAILGHANPHWRSRWSALLEQSSPLRRLAPMSRASWLALARRCRIVLTDSGGAAEELPYLGVPLLCFRRASERREAHASGHARRVDPDLPAALLRAAILDGLNSQWPTAWPRQPDSPYGDGQAGQRAAVEIIAWLATASGRLRGLAAGMRA